MIIPTISHGTNPRLLLLSGMHGDEFEAVSAVKQALETMKFVLPDYIYIPEVSPSAIARKSRINGFDRDINRFFYDGTPDPEAAKIMEIISAYTFDICISFHEDPEYEDFYLYDSHNESLEGSFLLDDIRAKITAIGIPLLNGIDDPSDEVLGNVFENGYRHFSQNINENFTGFLSDWSYAKGYITRFFNPEIPGSASFDKKVQIAEILLGALAIDLPQSIHHAATEPSVKVRATSNG